MANPFLPLREYIPDGEPHVFGNRVYLYGSHDREGGTRFCEQDYVVYSASVFDLENWTYHGITYKKSQDPRSRDDRQVDFYAPDCVQGNDGRYYLYYVAMGPKVKNFGPMSVAVSNFPEGPFDYLGDIRWPDGTPMTRFLTNDPAVLNENGRLWLYYGWGLGRDFRSRLLAPIYNFVQSRIFQRPIKEIIATKPSILSCAVVELEQDMLTVKSSPKCVLDSKTSADRNCNLYQHAFYEAASIRKFGDTYYLIYSSGQNNELCYATSRFPDRNYKYRGVLISNCDLDYKGNRQRFAPAGTIHGSVERINGNYYVFYHRCTHNTDFSRQACAEPIRMNPDGTFDQVEITTQGMGKPLVGRGIIPSSLCCNLFNKKMKNVQGNGRGQGQPNITHDENGQFITAIDHGTVIGFKYLVFDGAKKLSVVTRRAKGKFIVTTQPAGKIAAVVELSSGDLWQKTESEFSVPDGTHALYFTYLGRGKADFKEFEIV